MMPLQVEALVRRYIAHYGSQEEHSIVVPGEEYLFSELSGGWMICERISDGKLCVFEGRTCHMKVEDGNMLLSENSERLLVLAKRIEKLMVLELLGDIE